MFSGLSAGRYCLRVGLLFIYGYNWMDGWNYFYDTLHTVPSSPKFTAPFNSNLTLCGCIPPLQLRDILF